MKFWAFSFIFIILGTQLTFATTYTFEPGFSPEQKKIILDTIKETQAITPELAQPERVTFSLSTAKDLVAAGTDILNDKIIFPKISFQLHSKNGLRAVIAHEYMHLVVVRGFKSVDKTQSLLAQLNSLGSTYDQLIINSAHTPYAELLCDLVAVMVTRDPKVWVNLQHEMQDHMRSVPALQKYVSKIFADSPIELGSRDFTVSENDARWATFNPKDENYNRLNQIRSYLWHNGVKDLSPDQNARYFSEVFQFFSALYSAEAFLRLQWHFQWPDIMKQVMDGLDTVVKKPSSYQKQICSKIFLY